MYDFTKLRLNMVRKQVEARGVTAANVLAAMGKVPREKFVTESLRGLSYDDRPLVIAEGQILPQPYVAAFMIEALGLTGGERVLEIGASTGYAAAVLAQIAADVYTIERVGQRAERAASTLQKAGYSNVHLLHADGTRGWAEHAPFDAILVAGAVPYVPETLKNQLATGGRMVVPVGIDLRAQELVRLTRLPDGQFEQEDIADIRFVPAISEMHWEGETPRSETRQPRILAPDSDTDRTLPALIVKHAEVFERIEDADLSPLLERIGDRRVVLIGEASHGTSEFYQMRARITRQLIEQKGFNIVAVEADWPDAARIDRYVRDKQTAPSDWAPFARFPTWMWRNTETQNFADWLHEYNSARPARNRTAFYGLDLYSLFSSARATISYLEGVDEKLARLARRRYGCLSPWEDEPTAYGRAALGEAFRTCETEVTQVLTDLHRKRAEYSGQDGEGFLDATQNAYLVANAERYYRIMYYGSRAAWNLRDSHMFETLQNVMQFHGPRAKAVIWAHNSHIGDARATEMTARAEHNLGELCAKGFGQDSYRIGFGTDRGTVAAAARWDGAMETMDVRPAHRLSYEHQFKLTGLPGLILPMRPGQELEMVEELVNPRLERAIGVIYRPQSELASHYFEAALPHQFDEYIWIEETSAVTALSASRDRGMPDTYPFGV